MIKIQTFVICILWMLFLYPAIPVAAQKGICLDSLRQGSWFTFECTEYFDNSLSECVNSRWREEDIFRITFRCKVTNRKPDRLTLVLTPTRIYKNRLTIYRYIDNILRTTYRDTDYDRFKLPNDSRQKGEYWGDNDEIILQIDLRTGKLKVPLEYNLKNPEWTLLSQSVPNGIKTEQCLQPDFCFDTISVRSYLEKSILPYFQNPDREGSRYWFRDEYYTAPDRRIAIVDASFTLPPNTCYIKKTENYTPQNILFHQIEINGKKMGPTSYTDQQTRYDFYIHKPIRLQGNFACSPGDSIHIEYRKNESADRFFVSTFPVISGKGAINARMLAATDSLISRFLYENTSKPDQLLENKFDSIQNLYHGADAYWKKIFQMEKHYSIVSSYLNHARNQLRKRSSMRKNTQSTPEITIPWQDSAFLALSPYTDCHYPTILYPKFINYYTQYLSYAENDLLRHNRNKDALVEMTDLKNKFSGYPRLIILKNNMYNEFIHSDLKTLTPLYETVTGLYPNAAELEPLKRLWNARQQIQPGKNIQTYFPGLSEYIPFGKHLDGYIFLTIAPHRGIHLNAIQINEQIRRNMDSLQLTDRTSLIAIHCSKTGRFFGQTPNRNAADSLYTGKCIDVNQPTFLSLSKDSDLTYYNLIVLRNDGTILYFQNEIEEPQISQMTDAIRKDRNRKSKKATAKL